MTARFLRIARQGINSWKRYLVGALLPFCLTLIVWTPILTVTTYILGFSPDEEGVNGFLYANPVRTLVLSGLLFIAFLFGLYLSIKRVHKRKFITLFTSDDSVHWQRVIKGFGVYLGLYGIRFLVWYLISPSRYIFSFNLSEWLPFALLSLVFAPIFALCKVLIVAYLLQGISLLIQSSLLLLIVWGLIIGSLSYALEPETLLYVFSGVVFGIFFAWVIIKDNGIELMWGFFTASDFIGLVWFRSDDSDFLNAPTIFRATEPALPLYNLVSILLHLGLFYYICFSRGKNLSASMPKE
ncbi:MAG: hypothetical protein WA919_28580 [Coleofasciculaceae cyanobacterium]